MLKEASVIKFMWIEASVRKYKSGGNISVHNEHMKGMSNKQLRKKNCFKYQIIVCGWFAKAGTHGQEALRTKAAFIARVWIGLDSPPISLTIVHNAFNKKTEIQKVG